MFPSSIYFVTVSVTIITSKGERLMNSLNKIYVEVTCTAQFWRPWPVSFNGLRGVLWS